MHIKDIHQLFLKASKVVTDSRQIEEGCLFFALRGAHFDGNRFAEEAISRGATFAIVDDENLSKKPKCIYVSNTLIALQELANFHRKHLNIPIIGITGSNGKTTTKELVYTVLSKKFNCLATKGNFNNHIGVPLTLLELNDSHDIGIVEMGANHKGEIKLLSEIAAPNYGLITNYGKAHLEGFGGVEGIIKGKSELYDYLNQNNGLAFVKENDSIQLEKTINQNRHLLLNTIKTNQVDPFIRFNHDNENYVCQLMGKYNLDNINVAFAVGQFFKVPNKEIIAAICEYEPNNNRSQKVIVNGTEILLDAYNANPSSMEAAITYFASTDLEEKSLILGDMFELGESAAEEHRKIIQLTEKLGFKRRVFVGNIFYNERDIKAHFYKDKEELIGSLTFNELKGTKILIKGSRGMALEKIIPQFE